ncbi:thioredoxin-like 3-2, chloroplastic [Hordeum vulgare]|nr:thioredoxin-like 3-2, chloroplastic [Hordeum vulgare]
MATTSAHAAAPGAGDAAAPCRGARLRPRPPPHRLAFLSRAPARRASISLPPGIRRAGLAAAAAEGRTGTGMEEEEEEGPAWVELEPIGGEDQLDWALAEAQQRGVPIVVLWTASWCRKCIYLKPKLEKLAAEYYPRIRFYCVDVNAVPQKLVNRAGVTKMPSIQMWSSSQKQAEVIGGHESWMVIEDVRRMVEQEE